VDVITIQTNKPRGCWDDAKILWDKKNHVYGLKKEVTVQACAPHYTLFIQPIHNGSTHDYTIFKRESPIYLGYLRKSFQEKEGLPENRQNDYWAVCQIKLMSDPPTILQIFAESSPRRIQQQFKRN
jgi:hypothetical protein